MNSKRYAGVALIIFSIFVLLVFRLFYFQIYMNESLSKAASIQRMSNLELEKPRGDILDKNGIRFTSRNKKFFIVLKPLFLRDHEDELKTVCEELGEDFEKLKREIKIKREPILIEVDEEQKNAVMAYKINGISSINTLKRYDSYSVARHVLGYLNGIDQVGETGIEKFYEDVLKYEKENSVGVITDGRRNLVQGLGYRIVKAEDRNRKLHVKLTLDYHIQQIVDSVMDKNNISGAVVVEDINSGDIIAIASKPDFDQNNVKNYLKSPREELFNRAVASYNLGSIFKIIDVAAMLEAGNDLEKYNYCSGSIKVGNKEFRCSSYLKGGHGLLNLESAFALSCNPYFINAAIETGHEDILKMAKAFGLGSMTGIKRQGINESSGTLPSVGGYYTDGDVANIAIGQGDILASPLQVADIVATVANGGIKNRVNIVDSIVDSYGNSVKNISAKEGTRIISKASADTIKRLMDEVVASGTGSKASYLEQYGGAGGKTGSAETGQLKNGEKVVHAWFAGYFPKKVPRYSIAVFVENGKNGGEVAAPIFAEMAKEIMKKGF